MILKLKTTEKQCFGSAGCNVTVEPEMSWLIPDPGKLDGNYDLTYRINGDESGPVIGTITVYANGKYDMSEESISTSSTNTPVTVKVTSLSKW